MAMVKCKNCGKEITDIYDNCPYCKTPLHNESTKSDINDVTNDDLTENLILTGYGAFLSLVALSIFYSLMVIQGGRGLGDMAIAAIATAYSAFDPFVIGSLFVGAIAFSFLPLIIKKFVSLPDFIIYPIITIIFTVISVVFFMIFGKPLLAAYNTSAGLIDMASSFTFFYSLCAPMLMGSVIVAGKNHSPLFGVIFELVPVAAFVISGLLLTPLFVFVFRLGIMGLALSGVISLFVAFIASVVKAIFIKGF